MRNKNNDDLVKYVERMFGKDTDFKQYMADGHISRVCKILGVDSNEVNYQLMNITVKDEELVQQQNIKDYGTAKSGNWGHKGRIGKRGGSAKGTGSKAYRGQGKQYNTGEMSAEKYYGNRKQWANGLKGDKGHRADSLITAYAKRFDEALASGNMPLKKANTMKFDTPEAQQAYLATLEPWQVKQYHQNNTPPDPKKMTPTQKAAYAISYAQKGSGSATSFREKAQFVELMGEAKHWKQYKDKYIKQNLTQSQAEAMQKILDAYGGDEELITGTMYDGKYYPGEAPKGVAAAYTALKCKAMTERTTPINYHYQGGSDILGLLDPTKAAKSVQGMDEEKIDKMNAFLEPAIKELGKDEDGYPRAYKLSKTSSPGMVDKAEAAMLQAVDKKDIPLKSARKYLQLKGEGTTYQQDMQGVITALQNGEKIDMKSPFGKKMKKLMGADAQTNITALANLIKKYDTGKFATDVNAFEQHLAYKAKPQEQMAYLRLKAALLSDKTIGCSALQHMDESGKFDSAIDFSQYTGDEWSSWQGTGTDAPQNPAKNTPETPTQQSSEPSTTNTASQSPSEKQNQFLEVAKSGDWKKMNDWMKSNLKVGDAIEILMKGYGTPTVFVKNEEGKYTSDSLVDIGQDVFASKIVTLIGKDNVQVKLGVSSNQQESKESSVSVGKAKNIGEDDLVQIGTLGGQDNINANSALQGNTVFTDPSSYYKSPVSTNQPSGYVIAKDPYKSKMMYTATQKFKKWLSKIKGDMKSALDAYKDGAYDGINDNLGNGEQLSQHQKKVVRNIDKAMADAQLQQDSVMYRGAHLDDMLGYFSRQMNVPVGKINPVQLIGRTWHNEAYMSCSGSQQANWGSARDLQMVLCVPKGKGRGCYVDGVPGLCNSHEDEYLINRGSKMMINDVRYESTQQGSPKKWHVYVTILDYEQKQV